MMKLAVMQGRLLPSEDGRIQCSPKVHWREEFPLAESVGLYGIEWIDDTYSMDTNALHTDEGIAEIIELMEKHNLRIPSVCANIFVETPFWSGPDVDLQTQREHLVFLLEQGKKVGAGHVLLPFFGESELKSGEDGELAAAQIQKIIPELERTGMELHLEGTLDPSSYKKFLNSLDHPQIKVTYDTGNSAGLGFDPREEFAAYGNRIGSVHIKDKKKGGVSVPLGEGDADFGLIAAELKKIGFEGLLTLEVARPLGKNEADLVNLYILFVRNNI